MLGKCSFLVKGMLSGGKPCKSYTLVILKMTPAKTFRDCFLYIWFSGGVSFLFFSAHHVFRRMSYDNIADMINPLLCLVNVSLAYRHAAYEDCQLHAK